MTGLVGTAGTAGTLQVATATTAAPGSPATDEVVVAALSGLAAMGPARLCALLGAYSPTQAWAEVLAGRGASHPSLVCALGRNASELARTWARAAAAVDLEEVAQRHSAAGVRLRLLGRPGFPQRLAADPDPPQVLCLAGTDAAGSVPTVAIVGTRACTADGRETAFGLGRDLAAIGVAVVSGLARGIDGAAHAGALQADGGTPPIAVVATGLDVVYPRGHARLWAAVRERGLIMSEAPLGTRPERWRFPARNRLIAGLADVVVVVESHVTGGSLHTVDAALERAVPVLAVPGPVRSPASAGTNALLAERAIPCCGLDDILVALGLEGAVLRRPRPSGRRRPAPAEADGVVYEAVGWSPTSTETVLARTGLSPVTAAAALGRLCADGWIRAEGGWWSRTPEGGPGL